MVCSISNLNDGIKTNFRIRLTHLAPVWALTLLICFSSYSGSAKYQSLTTFIFSSNSYIKGIAVGILSSVISML